MSIVIFDTLGLGAAANRLVSSAAPNYSFKKLFHTKQSGVILWRFNLCIHQLTNVTTTSCL